MLDKNQSEFIRELEGSKNNITNNLGTTPHSFVFPFHNANSSYTALCGQYYELCWTTGDPPENPEFNYLGTNGTKHDSLKRISMQDDITFEEFEDIFGKELDQTGVWELNEGSGSSVQDDSGSGHELELRGGAKWGS